MHLHRPKPRPRHHFQRSNVYVFGFNVACRSETQPRGSPRSPVQRRWWRACLSMHYGCLWMASIRSLLGFVSLFILVQKSHTALPNSVHLHNITDFPNPFCTAKPHALHKQTSRWRDGRVMTEFCILFCQRGSIEWVPTADGKRHSNPIFGVNLKPQSSINSVLL